MIPLLLLGTSKKPHLILAAILTVCRRQVRTRHRQAKNLFGSFLKLFFSGALFVITGMLPAQSPQTKQWEHFISAHSGTYELPSDAEMGPLADVRNPDLGLKQVVAVCETVFEAVREAKIPIETFYEETRLPLTVAFTKVVEAGPRKEEHRYGTPIRRGNRISIPVRVSGGSHIGYGQIYLVYDEEDWYIELWSVDISKLPIKEQPEGDILADDALEDEVSAEALEDEVSSDEALEDEVSAEAVLEEP